MNPAVWMIGTTAGYGMWRAAGVGSALATEVVGASADNPWTEAGAFSIVLVVAFWLLRRSDSREEANEKRHGLLEAELRAKVAELAAQNAELRVRIAGLEARLEADGDLR